MLLSLPTKTLVMKALILLMALASVTEASFFRHSKALLDLKVRHVTHMRTNARLDCAFLPPRRLDCQSMEGMISKTQ